MIRQIVEQVFGFGMAFAFMIGYCPQIFKAIKTKRTDDLSSGMIILSIVGYLCGLGYMCCRGFGLYWTLNYGLGLIFCSFLLYLKLKYSSKPYKDSEFDRMEEDLANASFSKWLKDKNQNKQND